MKHTLIVKRKGHEQPFDDRKVFASVYAAALIAQYHEHASEELAKDTVDKVIAWLSTKDSVTSAQLRHHVHHLLEQEDKEVAYLYISHLDLD